MERNPDLVGSFNKLLVGQNLVSKCHQCHYEGGFPEVWQKNRKSDNSCLLILPDHLY